MSELEEPFGAPKVTQVVLTEIAQPRTVGKRVTRQLLGREGTQHLPAVRGRTDARGTVDRRAVIVAIAVLALAGVDAHPDP